MTTVINTPSSSQESSGVGFLIGAVLIIVFAAFLLYFGIPALNQMKPAQINVPAPQIVMPDKVDVNVQPAK